MPSFYCCCISVLRYLISLSTTTIFIQTNSNYFENLSVYNLHILLWSKSCVKNVKMGFIMTSMMALEISNWAISVHITMCHVLISYIWPSAQLFRFSGLISPVSRPRKLMRVDYTNTVWRWIEPNQWPNQMTQPVIGNKRAETVLGRMHQN